MRLCSYVSKMNSNLLTEILVALIKVNVFTYIQVRTKKLRSTRERTEPFKESNPHNV